MLTQEQIGTLRMISAVLWRCFVLAAALLMYWFVLVVLAGDWVYALQSKWFAVSRHDIALVNYCGLAILKIVTLVFFLFPSIAIQWAIRSSGTGRGK